MFSLGLGLTIGDFKRVFVYPRAVLIGFAAQLFVIPIIAFALVSLTAMDPELAFGVMILSFCPGGVMSNMISKLSRGDVALSISLTGIISLIAVFTISVFVPYAAQYFLGEGAVSTNTARLGLALFVITALPVSLGVGCRHYLTKLSVKLEPIIVKLASVLFIIIVVLSIVSSRETLLENLAKLGLLMIVLNLLLLMAGFGLSYLFKLGPKQTVTVAIETGMQNSALGITIGSLLVEVQNGLPVFSLPSGVYSITAYFIMIPFIFISRHYLSKHQS